MSPEQLVAAARAGRSQWVPLADGKRVRVQRPSEHDTRQLITRDADGKPRGLRADLPEVCRFTVGWEGFKEYDLIAGGADDPVDFHPDVFAVWIEDHRDEISVIAQAIIDLVIAHETAKRSIEKN